MPAVVRLASMERAIAIPYYRVSAAHARPFRRNLARRAPAEQSPPWREVARGRVPPRDRDAVTRIADPAPTTPAEHDSPFRTPAHSRSAIRACTASCEHEDRSKNAPAGAGLASRATPRSARRTGGLTAELTPDDSCARRRRRGSARAGRRAHGAAPTGSTMPISKPCTTIALRLVRGGRGIGPAAVADCRNRRRPPSATRPSGGVNVRTSARSRRAVGTRRPNRRRAASCRGSGRCGAAPPAAEPSPQPRRSIRATRRAKRRSLPDAGAASDRSEPKPARSEHLAWRAGSDRTPAKRRTVLRICALRRLSCARSAAPSGSAKSVTTPAASRCYASRSRREEVQFPGGRGTGCRPPTDPVACARATASAVSGTMVRVSARQCPWA